MILEKYTVDRDSGIGALVVGNLIAVLNGRRNAIKTPCNLIDCHFDFLKIYFKTGESDNWSVGFWGTFSINPNHNNEDERAEMKFSFQFYYRNKDSKWVSGYKDGKEPVWTDHDGKGKVAGYLEPCDPKDWHFKILEAMEIVVKRTAKDTNEKANMVKGHIPSFEFMFDGVSRTT